MFLLLPSLSEAGSGLSMCYNTETEGSIFRVPRLTEKLFIQNE